MGKEQKNSVEEPAALTYGMSAELRDSGLLNVINNLSSKDKTCLIRYIHSMEDAGQKLFEDISDDTQPYTLEELSARIDEAEAEIENGGGKSFKEMMDGFKQELVFGNRISGATVEG